MNEDVYRNFDECWTNNKNEFLAFMILEKSDVEYTPYYVSYKCDVVSNGIQKGFGFLTNLKAISTISDDGYFKKLGYLDMPVSSNAESHFHIPNPDSKIYIVRSKMKMVEKNEIEFYSFDKVYDFKYIKIEFEEFMNLNARQRLEIYKINAN